MLFRSLFLHFFFKTKMFFWKLQLKIALVLLSLVAVWGAAVRNQALLAGSRCGSECNVGGQCVHWSGRAGTNFCGIAGSISNPQYECACRPGAPAAATTTRIKHYNKSSDSLI